MKAAVLYGANDLRYEDVETPKCPEGGILVKMIACGICGSDLRTYGGGSSSAIYPSISGHEIAGENGFGYDPIFLSDELGKTFAESSDEEKNSISHRGRALKNLYDKLKKMN